MPMRPIHFFMAERRKPQILSAQGLALQGASTDSSYGALRIRPARWAPLLEISKT